MVARILSAASVGITLVARRTAANLKHLLFSLPISTSSFSTDRSVPGGPALGLGSAGGGDTRVGGDRGSFSEHTNGPDRAAQTIVDHCAGGRGLGGDSNWTAWQRKYHDDGHY